MTPRATTWTESNQRHLMAALAEVRAHLEQRSIPSSREVHPEIVEDIEPPPAIDVVTSGFGLSQFERSVLLLCAGIELDSSFAELCARVQGDRARAYPTFSLALAAFPDAHWSALTPAAPLRRWRLIEIGGGPGGSLTASPLRIDERILHFLTGIQYTDERLAGLLEPVQASDSLVPSHEKIAQRISSAFLNAKEDEQLPVFQLYGPTEADRRTIAAAACAHIGAHLMALGADTVPAAVAELDGLLRLLKRESALSATAVYIDADSISANETANTNSITRFLERSSGIVILSARDRWKPLRRPVVSIEVRKPTGEEQREVWHSMLSGTALSANGEVHRLVSQFNLNAPGIQASVREAFEAGGEDELAVRVWNAGRSQARPRMEDLAQRIESTVTWLDLVLPEAELQQLRDVAAHVTHRATVYDKWGFAEKSSRGLGISALFAGATGTGKTMAAEVLGNALRLDLFRIDLSSVVSKFIGETEKNLRRVFDAAEDGGAILFFDEADALFGKRSEVKDSHDRYANIEINYLLQRMESYRGLAILATNMKSALDPAFLRRIRFVVHFPFPDEKQRAAIWERVFSRGVPLENLDVAQLARLHLSGGNIRNIALNAAFLAAEADEPVRMSHLARAARGEYAKLERPLNEADLRGWR